MAQLRHLLNHDEQDGQRRALIAALQTSQVQAAALIEAGVSNYDANALINQLQRLGELEQEQWADGVREQYVRILDAATQKTSQLDQTPKNQQPREKARHYGIGALADHELLAVLLRTGQNGEGVLEMAQRLLRDHDGLIGLADLDVEELLQAEGLGPAKATEIAAAFELGRRLAKAKRAERVILRQPEDVAALLAQEMAPLRHEELWCLPLDTHSRLIGEPRMISRGDIDGTDAGPRAFFRKALQAGAANTIAVHNHPSGNPEASAADLEVTKHLRAAGSLVDVQLQDHIIIGDGGTYHSIRRSHPNLFQT